MKEECTFKPKINESSQWRFYFYESAEWLDQSKLPADVIKRNELWNKSKLKKLDQLKREQEMQVKKTWPFTPRKNQSRTSVKNSPSSKSDIGDYRINYKAVDKFVHRQELARCLKREKEVFNQQLESGCKITGDKRIEQQK